MAFVCLECYHNYNINRIPEHWQCECGGCVVDIDDMMVIPIKVLNYKNLKTMFCCSGHPTSDDNIVPYIMISLTDSFVLPEYLRYMHVHSDGTLIPNNVEDFVELISNNNNNNFADVYKNFKDAGFIIEISYLKRQDKLRMTLRYNTMGNNGIVDLEVTVDDQVYQHWLDSNYKFYEYTKRCPFAVNYDT